MEMYTYQYEAQYTPGTDLTGFDVEAADGHIGKVDEATYDDASSCIVVDTGFWIFGRKRMIPAGAVRSVDYDEKKIHVTMTKDQIKNGPDYDADRHRDDEAGYHRDVGSYYSDTMADSRQT